MTEEALRIGPALAVDADAGFSGGTLTLSQNGVFVPSPTLRFARARAARHGNIRDSHIRAAR
jgi:hypothetical protein